MKHVRSAYEAVCSEQQQTHQQSALGTDGMGHKAGGWSSLIWSLFESSTTSEEESSAEDMRKTIVHLEMAQRHLSSMFGVSSFTQLCPLLLFSWKLTFFVLFI